MEHKCDRISNISPWFKWWQLKFSMSLIGPNNIGIWSLRRGVGWSTSVLDSQIPFILPLLHYCMDREADAIAVVLLTTCSAALAAATSDKRSCRRAPSTVSTFPTTTFEDAMAAAETDWFHTKLRCDGTSFLCLYRDVNAAYKRKPAANSK